MLKGALIVLAVALFAWGVMWLFKKLVPGLRRINGANRDTRKTKKRRSDILRPTNERVVPTTVRSKTQYR